MGHLCRIKYVAYFYDKQIFDSSPNDGEGETQLVIGDIAWPEGLWRGLQNMRKGETAKIRIKKLFAFGRPGEVDALRWPHGFSDSPADAERRQKLVSKQVIYEVTLVDFTIRQDMEANGKYYKQIWHRARKNEYELPNTPLDEVVFSVKAFQGEMLPVPTEGVETEDPEYVT